MGEEEGMNAKEYLEQIRQNKVRIKMCRYELEEMESLLGVHSPNLDKVGAPPRNSYVADKTQLILKVTERQEQLEKEIIGYIETEKQAKEKLKLLTDPREVEVLFRKYFLFQSYTEMSQAMQYTDRALIYIHNRGIEHLQKVL